MIIQLTEAQRSVLERACNREDLCVFPITAALNGGAVGNVCKSLLKRGLLEEVAAADASTVFRHDENGKPLTLCATAADKRAIAGEPIADARPAPLPVPSASRTLSQPKASRQDTLLSLLGRPEGATIADMAEATGWQAHSVRGALSGVIGKKLGLKVVSEKLPERGRVYRVR